MANMSYCRFQNTLSDLMDCADHLHDHFDDGQNSRNERSARKRLIELCREIIEETGNVDDLDDLGTEKDDACPDWNCEECGCKTKQFQGICHTCHPDEARKD